MRIPPTIALFSPNEGIWPRMLVILDIRKLTHEPKIICLTSLIHSVSEKLSADAPTSEVKPLTTGKCCLLILSAYDFSSLAVSKNVV